MNTKLNFRLSSKTRLLLQTLHSNDDFSSFSMAGDGNLKDDSANDLNWGNHLYSLRLHSQVGKALFLKQLCTIHHINLKVFGINSLMPCHLAIQYPCLMHHCMNPKSMNME